MIKNNRYTTHRPHSRRWLQALMLCGGLAMVPASAFATQLMLWYPFSDHPGSTVIKDASGHHHNGTVEGNVLLDGSQAHLDGESGYIKLPDNLLSGLNEITIMTKVYIEPDQQTPYFIYGLGNTDEEGAGNNYLFTTGNFYRTTLSTCNWSCEQNTATPTENLTRGEWHHLAFTLKNGQGKLYLDGQQVAENDDVTITPQDLGDGQTLANYLGRSMYSADNFLHGSFDDFQIYDGALSATAVSAAAKVTMPKLTNLGAVIADMELLDVVNADDARGDLNLPTEGKYGSKISWISATPWVVNKKGIVHRPAAHRRAQHGLLTATIRKGPFVLVKLFTVTVPPMPEQQPYKGYFFTYFIGEGYAQGEQIYAALSEGNDPLHWQTLNDQEPILTTDLGEEGARDPFIIRSPDGDKFYLIATDLKVYGNGDWGRAVRNGSQSLLVWESNDLVNWSEPRLIKVSPDTAGNTWAPEAFWDPQQNAYIVFWASELYDTTEHTNDTYHKMLYATTRDFVNFSKPKVWVDAGYSTIDSTIIQNDGLYYRFTKDERSAAETACGDFILSQTSTYLTNTNWDFQTECIGQGTIRRGEGPLVFKSNTEDTWYMFIDEYGYRGYVPFMTNDLDSGDWQGVTDYSLPGRPRHGTVLPVTQQEYDAILEKWGQ